MTKPRVRFAPSPTGYLHIGGARTALFNWLFARHTGGTFLLRIEDTDVARNTQEAIEVILHGLRWLGLDWDEGPLNGDPHGAVKGERGPYFQSARQAIYHRRVSELRDKGFAYEHEGAIHFRMTRDPVVIHDDIVGEVRRELTDREVEQPDFVVVRRDGQPVFHLVNVVDDIEMGITHVIRGEDHLTNTAKHICLFRAFEAPLPHFAHIPLILNPDGSKMSKRDQGSSLQGYIDSGYAPEALVNYLALLGWTPRQGGEIFTKEEAAAQFELSDVHRSHARYDLKKLEFFHFEHTRRMSANRFVELGVEALARAGIETRSFDETYRSAALLTAQEKGKLFRELPQWVGFYFQPDESLNFEADAAPKLAGDGPKQLLGKLRSRLASLDPFTAQLVEGEVKALANEQGVKAGLVVQPTRVACTGRLIGPSLYHLMEVLGKNRVLSRLDAVMTRHMVPP